jgi:hypothetical protein
VNALPVGVPTMIECGQSFHPSSGGNLTLTGRFPAAISSTQDVVSGTVDVTAVGGTVRGVVVPAADVFLVRDGRIATMPQPQDLMGTRLELTPGTVETLPAQATLAACAPGAGAENELLKPGKYELYARVLLNHDDGSSTEVFGGPWPLELS